MTVTLTNTRSTGEAGDQPRTDPQEWNAKRQTDKVCVRVMTRVRVRVRVRVTELVVKANRSCVWAPSAGVAAPPPSTTLGRCDSL